MRLLTRLFLLLALLTGLSSCGEPPVRNPVMMIGIDGAEWSVIDSMIERGELPNFARFKKEGAYGHLINPGPQSSPIVWTTFATGHFPRRHGILDFVFPYTPGAKKPVDVTLRQEPAIWNLASELGLSVGVIGYFVSHPAEQVNGFVVSEFAPGGTEGALWPPDLLNPEDEAFNDFYQWNTRWPIKRQIWERFFSWEYNPDDAENPDSPYQNATRLVVDRVDKRLIADEYLRLVTLALAERPTDLFITYFRLVDFMGHSLWFYHDPSDFEEEPDPFDKKLLGGMLEESYRYMDEILGDLLLKKPGANFVIVSDHGFGSATGGYKVKGEKEWLLTGNHRPNGVFMAYGPDVRAGDYEGITIMEIMPTLCALLGLPVSRELPGHVEDRFLRDEYLEDFPVRTVARYDFDWRRRGDVDIDPEVQLERLKSLRGLGYIGEGALAPSEEAGDYDFWEAEAGIVAVNVHGEVVYALLHDDLDEVRRVMNIAQEKVPELVPQIVGRVRAKILALQEELPGHPELAPNLNQFLEEYQ